MKASDAVNFSSKGVIDTTLYSNWLSNTGNLTRHDFEYKCLGSQTDCLVVFYTSEVISIQQRTVLFQVDLLSKHLGIEAQVFSYDTNTQGFPRGVEFQTAPPHDLDGSMDGT